MAETVKRACDFFSLKELPEGEFECHEHGAYIGKPRKLIISDRERIVDPDCPLCSSVKAEEKAREETAWLKRQKDIFRETEKTNELTNMNIGEKFWDESFESFDAYTPELEHHLDICVKYANNHKGRMLVMLGNHGNGKDHLAASILKRIGGYMYSVFEIELLLKDAYSGKTSEFEIYQKLCNEASLLIINEIGRHKSGDWETHFLSYIINKRYENWKPVILISNKHLKDDCPGCDDCLQKYLGNDVISRIVESGEILIFTGEDYRYRKRVMRE